MSENDAALLQWMGTDAAKWAAEFRQTAIRLGYSDMDEGWLIGWFANAIEARRPVLSRSDAKLFLKVIEQCPSDLDWDTLRDKLQEHFPHLPWREIMDEVWHEGFPGPR